MKKLNGKIALVTGGNSGIGYATAAMFAAEGAQVIITGRRQAAIEEAVAALGHGVVGLVADAADIAATNLALAEIKTRFGRLDILFANAGVGALAPLGQITEEHFDREFDINVKGLFFTVQNALPLMPDGASIILNASIAAEKGMGAFSVYSATKAAVRSFARTWTTDLKPRRIRVNAISPGPIETPIYDKMGLSAEQAEGFAAHIATQVPLGRFGAPADVAKAALYLASDDSGYVTGINLTVDGGMSQV